jgi:hypothetical protein
MTHQDNHSSTGAPDVTTTTQTLAESIRWAIRQHDDFALETGEIVNAVIADRDSCLRILDAMAEHDELASKPTADTRVWWPTG